MHFSYRLALWFATAVLLCSAAGPRPLTVAPADSSDEAQIRAVLQMQADAWNRGDIDAFMTGYWKSDQTAFVGAHGLVRGWQAVLDRYRRDYPDRKIMGHLTFSNLEVHILCPDAAFVIGQFQLQREKDQPSGIFSLDFKKFPEGWRIVLDHTSAFAPAASH
ncbi:MAG: nuclear transport factor 2 family protein [Candidatus Acidiferrales bacterium]